MVFRRHRKAWVTLSLPWWLAALLNLQSHGSKARWAQCQQDMTTQPEHQDKPPFLTGWPGTAATRLSQRTVSDMASLSL